MSLSIFRTVCKNFLQSADGRTPLTTNAGAGNPRLDNGAGSGRRWVRWPLLAEFLGIAVWLWPIGFGGRMPVGGDVTQFSLGLMAVLSRALRAGALPVWNDLWGFGFPGIGESQMGVYYPPHWLLYGGFAPEIAYTLSLVLHTYWGGLGAYFAARRFGASEAGAALGGFAWSTCGFFVVHLSHQWGYTTGSWMPWAWGLAWSILRNEAGPRGPLVLALVLALQLLPGHFQLAFCTQVGVALLAVASGVETLRSRSGGWDGVVRVAAATTGAFALSAMQLWPTLRLARLAAPRRDFEYLSGFAATPLHLVTFVAPALFERSPLWRLLVWDPFNTSPEEYLGFVGVVPLFLAVGALATGWRRSPAVRALGLVAALALWLSLGPYVPGFEGLIRLPGFSFFRAPSRWTLAASLALCLLASIGFDSLATWKRPGRALVGFVVVTAVWIVGVIGAVELALASTEGAGWPGTAVLYSNAFDRLPWRKPSLFKQATTDARKPFLDSRVYQTWAQQGVRLKGAPAPVFAALRAEIYREELAGTGVLLLALLGAASLAGRRSFPVALAALAALEMVSAGRLRRVDFGPMATLASQSPVVARLAETARGVRAIDHPSHGTKNLLMVPGSGTVLAYRTLDLPALDTLATLAGQTPTGVNRQVVLDALRLTGARVRLVDPFDMADLRAARATMPGTLEAFQDPALAGWVYGRDWVDQQGPLARSFLLATDPVPSARAWRVPLTPAASAAILGTWSRHPADVLRAMAGASPLEVEAADSEHRALTVRTDGEALVVLGELADPQWRARLADDRGRQTAVPVERAFGRPNQGAWQAVRIPGAGTWRLSLAYRANDVYQGLAGSGLAAVAWIGLFVAAGRSAR